MAFSSNTLKVKKRNYNVFVAIDNKQIAVVDDYATDMIVINALTRFPSNMTDVFSEIGYVFNESSPDIAIINSGDFTSDVFQDFRLRFGIRLSDKKTFAFIGGVSYPVLDGLLPIGICLSEAEMIETKGDEVKLFSGDTAVIDKNVSFKVIVPRANMEMKNFLQNISSEKIGVLFKDITSREFAYLNEIPLVADVMVKSNALGQLILSGNYSAKPTEIVLTIGDDNSVFMFCGDGFTIMYDDDMYLVHE